MTQGATEKTRCITDSEGSRSTIARLRASVRCTADLQERAASGGLHAHPPRHGLAVAGSPLTSDLSDVIAFGGVPLAECTPRRWNERAEAPLIKHHNRF